jgi:hypothetical protein
VTADGASWERVDGGALSDLRLERVEELGGRLVVAGERAAPCPGSGDPLCHAPMALWSDDGGVNWNESALPFEPGAVGRGLTLIADMATTDTGLIVVGRRPSDTRTFGSQLWRSSDGASWQELPTDQFEPGTQLGAAGMVGDHLVVTGTTATQTNAAWRSADGGTTWTRADALPAQPVSSNVGSGPIPLGALDDADRTQWGVNAIPAPDGWLLSWVSVDPQTFPTDDDARAAVSRDGVTWTPVELPEGRAVAVATYVGNAYVIATFREDVMMADPAAAERTVEVYRLQAP